MFVSSFVVLSLSTFVAIAQCWRNPTLSNQDTSLRILYQNNLNSTDDINHVPFLLLDPIEEWRAEGACKAFGEQLMDSSIIHHNSDDFKRLFAYLTYSHYGAHEFYIHGGILSTYGRNGDFSVRSTHFNRFFFRLPVICTQTQGKDAATDSNAIVVKSNANTYHGFRNQKAFNFRGIPFANTPARFTYSQLYSGRGKTIDATAFPEQCAQAGSGSEDCLYLSISSPYIPKERSHQNLKPVLFWIHGGGYTGGNGASDGSNLASREDIVFVSIQYRLSTLGFLAVPGTDLKGNYGIGDQVTALKWVRENIASFGGDPNKITIMGESAGGASVRVLLGSPPAIDNFRGAISMSNLGGGVSLGLDGDYSTPYSSYLTINAAYQQTKVLFGEAGCNQATVADQVECLKTKPALDIVALPDVARYVVQDGTYVNTEQLIVSTKNESTAHVPVMFGIMADDGASIISYPKTPVTSEDAGLESMLYISSDYANSVISSGLFPYPDTGNMTLDAFNVSARVATDVGFRCIDQATVYAGALSDAFPSAYFYQFDRSIGGYDPNNVGNPPPSPGHPRGDPSLPYFKVHAGDVESALGGASPSQIREPEDLWFIQLVSGYWSSFARSLEPNPPKAYLEARGYEQTLKATEMSGPWEAVGKGSKKGPIHRLDWPPHVSSYLETEQCSFLNYSLSYYIGGNRG